MALTDKSKATKLWKKNLRKFCNNKLAMIGFVFFLIITVACILAPLLTGYDPSKPDFASITVAPCAAHILGTDKLGRDIFARVLYGGRVSILVGVVGALSGSLIGIILGSIAGYFGKWVDSLLIRISEVFQTFPNMILILLMVAVLGQGLN